MQKLSPPISPLMGQNVALRPFRLSDAAAVSAACADEDIPRYTFMRSGLTEDQARQWISAFEDWEQTGVARFAVTVPGDDECVGQVGAAFDFHSCRAETFYWLARHARGRGLASEALELVTQWCFREHRIFRAQLVTNVDNVRSQSVAERAGYRREGVLRGWERIGDDQPDVVMFGKLRTD